MKKVTFVLFAFALACTLRAAVNDQLLVFSTKGPDLYADGTVVKDGECYALVWTAAGASFGGISPYGKAISATDDVVITAPVAKGGRCPTVLFQISSELIDTKYKNGSFGVYLLDTRTAAGAPAGVGADGNAVAVKGFGAVDGVAVAADASVGALASAAGAAVKQASSAAGEAAVAQVLADAPKPQIKAVKIVGGKVYLTVANTVGYLAYDVAVGETPNAVSKKTGKGQFGKVGEDVTLIVDADGASGFYKVTNK